MDLNNPLRGPRRAARRGEEALRYDRPNSHALRATTKQLLAETTTRTQPPQEPTRRLVYDPATEEYSEEVQRPDGQWVPLWRGNSPQLEGDPYDRAPEEEDGDFFETIAPLTDEDQRNIARQEEEYLQRVEAGLEDVGALDDMIDRREILGYDSEEDNTDDLGNESWESGEGEGEEDDDVEEGGSQEQRNVQTHGEGHDEGHGEGRDDDDTDSFPNSDDFALEAFLREQEQYGAQPGRDGGRGDNEESMDADVEGGDLMHGGDGVDDDDIDVEGEVVDVDGDDEDAVISFDPMLLGLKEINNLAHFSVSSHKPGNGVEELLHDDLNKYWQSDGLQPHLLTIHFLRRVEIRAIRFYVDYNQDESYTPTSVVLSAGTGHHDLLEFASLALTTPVGWQEIDLSGVGGGADGQSLCCWIVQIKVKENHQNGKDTHIRGIKLYAIDENAPPADGALDELARIKARTLQIQHKFSKDTMTDKDDYLFERLITQSPDKLPGAPERSGSMATFLRDEEIR